MSETIIIKIDVTKINKSKMFEGKKGVYLDIVLIPTPGNQYGNTHMAVQGLSKEDRDAGQKGVILGNAKTIGGSGQQQDQSAPPAREAAAGPSDDVPF